MNTNNLLQLMFFMGTLLLLVKPLGSYMARVYQNERIFLDRVLGPVERLIYRASGIRPTEDMDWKSYAAALLVFNMLGLFVVYAQQRLQLALPFNPQGFSAVTPDSAWNTAVSFASNTNWQSYGGETTMSHFTQMLSLTVQNFVSAATGMAVLVALIRGIARHSGKGIGNFWVDLTRSTLYILLPLSFILAMLLVSQGVVQTFNGYRTVSPLQSAEQVIAVGPAASQIAIKQLGTNGGGFFNANSAHPFENPTPFSNFLEMLSILLIPAALCYTFGQMVGDLRQGWALLTVMTIIFLVLVGITIWSELGGNPALPSLGIDQIQSASNPGGNMEGKEVRFGIVNSALWATATTAASNGSVNAMHDSFMPLSGLVPMWLMQLGEIIYGGVGSGLYGMLAFVIVAVFISGLMVGRTPEYLGKKIEAYEMKMASLIILIPVTVVLTGTALAVSIPDGRAAIYNPTAHGFSEVLYAFSSAGNNNGSAFAGLSANSPFYNLSLGIAMLISRYWLAVPVLAIAGSLVRKKKIPASAGTLPTHTPLFMAWLIGVITIVGALSFIPALALGPIVEYLTIIGG
ncbi:MAG TPA: potassium-transporting ATPase subunit KdpA [Anaerolineales bacterium]|nr:potassium-transporting ATPase subunit KdpA [Anaerolineales bacterium]HNC87475.1 potassium-transporting ATPase subunit KdpA [Anaerolineales bacterium]HND90609.1 potassium-transporting ATPase subunit KdpA [Anaerolineales bacterium]HNF33175.1 potassium-transporting ATPase subunit KdpA [Anaerolineales bacterium]